MIYLDCGCLNLIGDCLSALPYIAYLGRKHGGVGMLNGPCVDVLSLLEGSGIDAYQAYTAEVLAGDTVKVLNISDVFHHCNMVDPTVHMAQGWFVCNGEPVPSTPITLPLQADGYFDELEPYAVISPFSRSDYKNNKLWPLDRWTEVIHALLSENRVSSVRIVGNMEDYKSVKDNFRECRFMIDERLPKVLSLLRYASIVMTIDNGIGHLCHMGGVDRHLMIQPQCLSQAFVANPRGQFIRGEPLDIQVSQVLDLARRMLV